MTKKSLLGIAKIDSWLRPTRNPVDPAGGDRYWSSIKPCESRGNSLGVPLSNTWITCPVQGDNLAKVRIIPHSSPCLERLVDQSSGGTGWVCGVSGCRGCNGPPSHRRVRVVGAIARRWILRHESRPYGVQQARKLDNARNRDQGTPSGPVITGF